MIPEYRSGCLSARANADRESSSTADRDRSPRAWRAWNKRGGVNKRLQQFCFAKISIERKWNAILGCIRYGRDKDDDIGVEMLSPDYSDADVTAYTNSERSSEMALVPALLQVDFDKLTTFKVPVFFKRQLWRAPREPKPTSRPNGEMLSTPACIESPPPRHRSRRRRSRQAVSYLGLSAVRSMVLSAEVFRPGKPLSPRLPPPKEDRLPKRNKSILA